MRQIKQKDRRTGIEYVYESESYWDKNKKQSRYKPRKLIGHIDKTTGALVPNRPTRASQANPNSRRLFCGAAHLLDNICAQTGLADDLERAFPGKSNAVLSAAHCILSEGSPLWRVSRAGRALMRIHWGMKWPRSA